MKLHMLIVEDDDDFVEELRETIAHLPSDSDIRIAGSRDQAYEMLEEDSFLDLVILDLKLPTVSGALDADPKHGHAVFNRIRGVAPGTPIFVLTGSPAEDFIPELLKNQQQIDIWSEGRKTGTILFLRKLDIDKCPEEMKPVAQAIERLYDVELDRDSINLSLAEDRLIRIFAKKFQGVRCIVSGLGGGVSGARVIRLRITDSQGVQVHDAVAKLSTPNDVRQEGDRYEKFVARLTAAATPRKLATLEFGAHKLAGVFFGLADGFNKSAFDVARDTPEQSETVIRNLEAVMVPWIKGVPETRLSIRQIRQRLLNDQSLDEVRDTFDLDWIQEFEKHKIQARWGCSHGDFHGCNVLVSATEEVALIDYGNVGDGPASLDPVTLELSFLFHPNAPDRSGVWPSAEQTNAWGNLDVYLDNCPYPKFVRECRAWALRSAAGNREVAASAYSYLMGQLKYEDTDKDLALTLLKGVRSFYERST